MDRIRNGEAQCKLSQCSEVTFSIITQCNVRVVLSFPFSTKSTNKFCLRFLPFMQSVPVFIYRGLLTACLNTGSRIRFFFFEAVKVSTQLHQKKKRPIIGSSIQPEWRLLMRKIFGFKETKNNPCMYSIWSDRRVSDASSRLPWGERLSDVAVPQTLGFQCVLNF